ncbi:MAG: RluA family pseudouridine synthase [Clostridia bacterium]|nr:RluA family pseudouridine synthase [Clostridia bacterium]
MDVKKYVITDEFSGNRLDKVIILADDSFSRMAIQRLLDEKKISVNGKNEKQSYKVKTGDVIEVVCEEPKDADIKPEDIPLDVLYEDDDIVIVNKAKGMVVHPGAGNESGTLVNAIMARCKDSLSGIGGEIRPGIVHRIDKDTSGVLIIAKNDKAHINISEQIKNHEVKKTYVALVRGRLKENEATIDMPIGRSSKDRKKMAVSRDGKNAVTHIKVIKKYDEYTYLEVNIETGRTHQIRVHLSEIGFPIVGDYTYSNEKNPFGVEGQMLHAKKIEFTHPTTREKVCFEAPLPEYFENVIKILDGKES